MEDITNQYKMVEGDVTERMALLNAVRANKRARKIYDYQGTDKVVCLLEDIPNTMFGKNFTCLLSLENKYDSVRTLDVMISSQSVYYTGVMAKNIKEVKGRLKLGPGEKDKLKLEVT